MPDIEKIKSWVKESQQAILDFSIWDEDGIRKLLVKVEECNLNILREIEKGK
jgi:hypothetical protein